MIKMECSLCKKKIKVSSYPCKCEKYFCKLHLPETEHNCKYNYKDENKKLLTEKNPIIVAVKM